MGIGRPLGCFLPALLLAALVPACLNACVSTITPPADPKDPCSVYLIKNAMHAGIILPDWEKGFVEYGFGDRDWYALNRDRWYNVFDTVLWPTQGCLGRRKLSRIEIDSLLFSGKLSRLTVDRAEAGKLLQSLNRRFSRNRSSLVDNSLYGMQFVHDERWFWFLHNCNDAVAEWMESLSCHVSWVPVRTGIRVRD